MARLRVLLVSDYYPPFIGGAQIQTRLLGEYLSSKGHDVTVATAWQNALPAAERDGSIEIRRLRQLRTLPIIARSRFQHHQPPFPDPVSVVQLRRLIRRFEPEIIHSYGWFSFSAAVAVIGLDVPLVITARDYGYSCAKRTLVYGDDICTGPRLLKCSACAGRHYGVPKGWIAAAGVLGTRHLLARQARGIHSISSYVNEIVRRDFLRSASWLNSQPVIQDVIASAAERPEGVQAGGEAADGYEVLEQLPTEPFILFVGAFRRVKGIEQLFAAYAQLDDPPPLVMLGTMEPDSPSIFPAGVHVITDLPHAAVLAVAGSSRCLFGVMPSLLPEPFGTVVCEVMSQGKPVIGTYPGGHEDIIEQGVNGLLVPRNDVDTLARAMQELLDDTALREQLGRTAAEHAQHFAASVLLPRIEQLYEKVVTSA